MAEEPAAQIIVVDDEEGIRSLFRESLEQMGYSCLEAGTGDEALQVLASNAVDLALIDIMMPGMSGLTLFQHARELYPDLAVILATAVDDANLMAQCLKEGACDYIVKPVPRRRLQTAVHEALKRRAAKLEEKRHRTQLDEIVSSQAEASRNKDGDIKALNRWIHYGFERISGQQRNPERSQADRRTDGSGHGLPGG